MGASSCGNGGGARSASERAFGGSAKVCLGTESGSELTSRSLIPAPRVLEELVQECISARIVEQIADVSVPLKEEHLVEVPEKFQQRVDEQIVDILVPKVDLCRSASRSVSWTRSPVFFGAAEGEQLVEVPKAVF